MHPSYMAPSFISSMGCVLCNSLAGPPRCPVSACQPVMVPLPLLAAVCAGNSSGDSSREWATLSSVLLRWAQDPATLEQQALPHFSTGRCLF